MADPRTRIQDHLGLALRELSRFERRVAEGDDPSRDAARCLDDLQRVAQELEQAAQALQRERQRAATLARNAASTLRQARRLLDESAGPYSSSAAS